MGYLFKRKHVKSLTAQIFTQTPYFIDGGPQVQERSGHMAETKGISIQPLVF